MTEKEESEIFTVRARRCKRCGGLLTSKQAVAEGYGHVCKMKALGELQQKRPLDGQLVFPGMEDSINETIQGSDAAM